MKARSVSEALGRLLRHDTGEGGSAELVTALRNATNIYGGADLPVALAAQITQALADTNRVSVIVTGLGWLGGGVRAIESALLELIAGARSELGLAAYAMSPGTRDLWKAIEYSLDSGVRCTVIIDRLEDQNPEMRDWFRMLSRKHRDGLRIVDFRGEDANDHLHAKIVVADRRKAIVGSANLTAHGLLLGHELALLVEGPVADEIARRIDLLARSSLVSRA